MPRDDVRDNGMSYENSTSKDKDVIDSKFLCDHYFVPSGEPQKGCGGECLTVPVKCSKCGLEAREIYMYSCTLSDEDDSQV